MRSEAKLGEVCSLISDCPHNTAPESDNAYAYAVGTKAISGGRIDFGHARPVDARTYERWIARATPSEGDLIFCREAPVGPVAAVPKSPLVCLGQRTVLLRPDPTVADRRFVLHALLAPSTQAALQVLSEGSTVPHLNVSEIRDFPIPLPSLAEQRRIAGVLGALDDKIDSNRRLAGLLEETAATLFKARFVHFVGVEEFQDSEVGPIPVGWTVGSAYDVATVTYGRPFKSSMFNDAEGIPLVRIRDLATGEPSVLTSEQRGDGRLIAPGDIVVGMDGEFRAYLWAGPSAWLNQRVCVFDPVRGASRAFVLEAIKGPLAFFEATKGGTTVIHLGKADIDTFQVVLPSGRIMHEFAEAADPLIGQSVALRLEVRTLAELRDALLPKLISGAIRVPDTSDVAEVIGPLVEAVS